MASFPISPFLDNFRIPELIAEEPPIFISPAIGSVIAATAQDESPTKG